MKNTIKFAKNEDMKSTRNMLIHGVYLTLYSFVKYLSFPFSNLLRYYVLNLFSKTIKTKYLSDGVSIMFPWRVTIASSASINRGSSIDGFGNVRIGKGVRIANNVSIYTADHAFENRDELIMNQGYRYASVVIEEDVWIGGHTCVNKGVTIGKGSVIGSGAVVTKDIPPFSIAVGVPCRVIGKRK